MFDVVWIGEIDRPEFAPAAALLRERARVRVYAAHESISEDADARPCDLIVVAQRLPGDVDEAATASLRRRFPTSPVVRLLGPWCEGERRSFVPANTFAYGPIAATYELARDLDRLARGELPRFAAPATASDEERCLFEPEDDFPESDRSPMTVRIEAKNSAMRQWLADACRAHGAEVVNVEGPQTSEPMTILLDATFVPQAVEQTATLRRRYAQSQIVAFTAFARPRDLVRLREAGADWTPALPLGPDAWSILLAPPQPVDRSAVDRTGPR